MNPIIKTLLIRRSQEQGFVLPTVIALGLIMLLLGTVNIFKSNDENITAIAQRDTSEALTAAEAGVSFYRDLIDKNKVIATYSACDAGLNWNSGTNQWTCSDTTEISWARASAIPGINDSCDFDGGSANNVDVQNATLTGWQNVNGNLGQYRLVNYTYNNNLGTLIVQGRDRNSDSESAITQVQVQFPIQANTGNQITENLNNFNPVLWIGSSTITSIGGGNTSATSDDNLVVDGNIVVSQANCNLTGTTLTTANNLGNISATPLSLPATPSPPDYIDNTTTPPTPADGITPFYALELIDPLDVAAGYYPRADRTTNTKLNVVTNDDEIIDRATVSGTFNTFDPVTTIQLPRPGDNSEYINGENVYHYLIEDNLNLGDGDQIRITKGANVILYVMGNITFDGKIDVNKNAGSNTSKNLQIYGNSGLSQFGCNFPLPTGGTQLLSVTCPNDDITFQGNKRIRIEAFIHAPNATVTSSSGDPNVIIRGAMWVKQWNDTTLANKKVTITSDDNFLDYASVRNLIGTSNSLIKPIIYPASYWTTQRVTLP